MKQLKDDLRQRRDARAFVLALAPDHDQSPEVGAQVLAAASFDDRSGLVVHEGIEIPALPPL